MPGLDHGLQFFQRYILGADFLLQFFQVFYTTDFLPSNKPTLPPVKVYFPFTYCPFFSIMVNPLRLQGFSLSAIYTWQQVAGQFAVFIIDFDYTQGRNRSGKAMS